jgi:hypothetical protein
MHTCISPLLLCCTWAMPRTPRRHAAIVGFPQEPHGDSRRCGLLLQAVCIWEAAAPGRCVSAAPRFDADVGLEADVGCGIAPVFGTVVADLRSTLTLSCLGESAVVLFWLHTT